MSIHSFQSRLLTLLLALTFSNVSASTFRSSQSTINYGESCTLTWSSTASEAYMSGVGRVPGKGSIKVAPEAPTDYILVTNTGKHIEYITLHIDVTGLKGLEQYPDPDDFHPGMREEKKTSYVEFLTKVTTTLQKSFAYHVRGLHMPTDRFFLMYTNWAVQQKMILPTDKGIRRRQVAYAVQVNEPKNGVVTFDVRALVQYQRMGESAWRTEEDSTINRIAEQNLEGSLEK